MPRWLRYLVSISSALMTYFIFAVLIGGIAQATGHKPGDSLGAGLGLIAALGTFFVPGIVMLFINDWLAARYPVEPPREPAEPVPDHIES